MLELLTNLQSFFKKLIIQVREVRLYPMFLLFVLLNFCFDFGLNFIVDFIHLDYTREKGKLLFKVFFGS